MTRERMIDELSKDARDGLSTASLSNSTFYHLTMTTFVGCCIMITFLVAVNAVGVTNCARTYRLLFKADLPAFMRYVTSNDHFNSRKKSIAKAAASARKPRTSPAV